ncbi:hypothetical protein LSAT2_002774 [Lamellibrachia satsuma]|nr:hypothetical protein LSAT2_002774 [Lamellibrachia satsuma]
MKVILVDLLLLVSMVLRCHANGDVVTDDSELACKNNCDEIYWKACLRECRLVLIEMLDALAECRKKCYLERAHCIADCEPWWRDW